MDNSDARTLAHARAIRARGMAMPPDGLPAGLILDSWARCMEGGLRAETMLSVPVVEAAELARRRSRSEFVRRLAQAELETLSRQIAGSNFLLAFADADGVILDLYADNRFAMSGSDAGILPGSIWAESVTGTNGLGTALSIGGPVQVTGTEHYFFKLGEVSCTAAPVRDARGQVVGVLDASSYFESRQRHTQALVQMAATHIENGLLAHQMQGQLVLAVHPRAEYLGTLSAGLLAFDGGGQLLAQNAPARHLLSGLDASPGAHFETLFGEPMEQVLARLQLRSDVRLRDSLGSSLMARMVGRPAGAAGRTSSTNHANGANSANSANSAGRTSDASCTSRTSQINHANHAVTKSPAPGRRRELKAPAPLPSRAGSGFLMDDPAVAEACRIVEAAVRMRAPILLHGETGTGKELLARHAHHASGRSGEFVAVNCGAMPTDLFEAELFGYAPGAYSGARREGNAGLIVAADGGTLLLDEVRELPLQMQAALLRFLDDQTVRPLGAHGQRRVDVQLLAATHADLEAEVAARRFREDLMYRLNTVRVSLPPLRSRRDLPQAVRTVLGAIDAQAQIEEEAVTRLAAHDWPGNFRELRAVLTRALLQRRDTASGRPLSLAEVQAVLPASGATGATSGLQRQADDLVRTEFERCGQSISRTARALGISRTTVYRHLRA